MPVRRPLAERFRDFVSPEPNSGCWLWLGSTTHDGYAKIGTGEGKSMAYAHRVAFELSGRKIPPGHDLDHLCRVRCCVNPAHLEAVTRKVNLARGNRHEPHPLKEHCGKGHRYDESSTYTSPDGRRQCRECIRIRRQLKS